MQVLEIKNLFKSYFIENSAPYPVLKDLNFDVNKGEFVAIMGSSGSGKSTLMNILGCLDVPTSGTYKIDGVDVGQLGANELSQIRGEKIGFVFQGFNLLMKRTLLDNVALPLIYFGVDKETREKKALSLLKSVGLEKFADRLPSQISGGQQQRVAIARALINDPKIILADEPTGNLDTKNSYEVMDLFGNLHKEGKTIVLITHEPDVAQFAKRLINLTDGVIKYDGAVDDFKK